MSRTSLVAAGLTMSVCLATASSASATASPSQMPMSTTSTLSATSVTPKQIAVDKIKSLLTTFFTDQQLSVMLDRMAMNIYAGKSLEEIFDTLIALDVLTTSQMVKLMKVESGLRTDLGATSGVPQTKARTVFLGSFKPFYMDASATVLAMKRSGKSKSDCLRQVDVILAKHLTKAKVTQALTKYKSSLTSKEWRSVRAHGADLLLWSRYGL